MRAAVQFLDAHPDGVSAATEPSPIEAGAPARRRSTVHATVASFPCEVRALRWGDPAAPPVLVLGGISADAELLNAGGSAPGWWPGLVEPDGAVDPARHHVIGVDFAADPRGKVAPSTHDQARSIFAALDACGVCQPVAVVGASYGGMVALALAELAPERVSQLVLVSAPARPHPAATAARELQRRVVALGLETGRAEEALAIARGLAMLGYRTPDEFEARFEGSLTSDAPLARSDAGDYLAARGHAFVTRMSPERYLSLSASIDRHCVDPACIAAPTLVIGSTSDQIVPPASLRTLAGQLGGPTQLELFDSLYGHDFFLKEPACFAPLVTRWLEVSA